MIGTQDSQDARPPLDMPDTWGPDVYLGTKPPCDIVMKGGVTSGIVYPFAICRIARNYKIDSIGGTSVGAIAAALAAAAEYERRAPGGTGAGYCRLARVPTFLQTPKMLEILFAADEKMRSFLSVALALVAVDARGQRRPLPLRLLMAGLFALRRSIPAIAIITGIAVIFNPLTRALVRDGLVRNVSAWTASIDLAMAVGVVLISSIASLLIFAIMCVRKTASNDFGWSHAHSGVPKPYGREPLVDWLFGEIERTANRQTQPGPLTLGDLAKVGIDFRVNTTCLSIHQPYTLPFDPQSAPQFFFRLSDFQKLFPAPVISYLSAVPVDPRYPGFRPFSTIDLPLVVAARMSMSFPIVFTAIKLYAVDKDGGMQHVWFSDGGLTSNMPVHFFDSPLPAHPTFAIDLLGSDPKSPSKKRHASRANAGDIFIEADVRSTSIDPWDRLTNDLFEFLGAIFETCRTWPDRVLGHAPGYSDRTVGIRLEPTQGGLNVSMPPSVIADLAGKGNEAGAKIVRRFSAPVGGWRGHRWTRLRGTMAQLSAWLTHMSAVIPVSDPVTGETYPQLSCAAIAAIPFGEGNPWPTPALAATSATEVDAVATFRNANWTMFDTGAPEPEGELGYKPLF